LSSTAEKEKGKRKKEKGKRGKGKGNTTQPRALDHEKAPDVL
jgi:hypothetical protein